MLHRVTESLQSYDETDVTCRLLRGVFAVLPYAPEFPHYRQVDDAVRALDPAASAETIASARNLANSPEINDILWMADLLDRGDKGYAIVTGVWSAWKAFSAKQPFDNDAQQRNDAVLKALGIAYMVYKAYPGSLADKAAAFRAGPNGQALAMYFASVEVALPFADNAASGVLDRLFQGRTEAQLGQLARLAGGRDVGQAAGMLGQLTGQLQRVVDVASQNVSKVADAAAPYVPGAMGAADKAAGLVASAADVLPVYRLLGARLAAEAAAWRAVHGA